MHTSFHLTLRVYTFLVVNEVYMGKNVCIPHLGMSGISGSAHGMVFKLTSRNSLARDGKQMMPPIYSYG